MAVEDKYSGPYDHESVSIVHSPVPRYLGISLLIFLLLAGFATAMVLTGGLAAIPAAVAGLGLLGITLGTVAGNVAAIGALTALLSSAAALAATVGAFADRALFFIIKKIQRLVKPKRVAADADDNDDDSFIDNDEYYAAKSVLNKIRFGVAVVGTVTLAALAVSTLLVLTGGLAGIPIAAMVVGSLDLALGIAATHAAAIVILTGLFSMMSLAALAVLRLGAYMAKAVYNYMDRDTSSSKLVVAESSSGTHTEAAVFLQKHQQPSVLVGEVSLTSAPPKPVIYQDDPNASLLGKFKRMGAALLPQGIKLNEIPKGP
jgi:hypothetical protein